MRAMEWVRRFQRKLTPAAKAEPEPQTYSSGYIIAPWTQEQVDQLNRYQHMGLMHPFTCGSSHRRSLTATIDGWVCPGRDCHYTQDWAHARMANRELLDEMAASMTTFYRYTENDD